MATVRVITIALMLFGAVLHTFTWTMLAATFAVGFWLLSLSPYIASAILYFLLRKPYMAAGAAVLSALFDTGAFYWAFVDPRSDMAGLALIVVPIWNILLLVPVGAGLGWWVGRRIASNANRRSNPSLEAGRER